VARERSSGDLTIKFTSDSAFSSTNRFAVLLPRAENAANHEEAPFQGGTGFPATAQTEHKTANSRLLHRFNRSTFQKKINFDDW
jgi:hypothetical protein